MGRVKGLPETSWRQVHAARGNNSWDFGTQALSSERGRKQLDTITEVQVLRTILI